METVQSIECIYNAILLIILTTESREIMPHLWMFLLQAANAKGARVILIDGNAKASRVKSWFNIARMRTRPRRYWGHDANGGPPYLFADAIREAGIPV